MRKPARYPAPSYLDQNDRRMVRIIKPANRPGTKAVNILGVPFDRAVLGRKGAAAGPEAIRHAMAAFSNYNVELGIGLERSRVFDLGDLEVGGGDVNVAHSRIESEVGDLVKSGSLLVILGGDNSISLPSLRACSKELGKLGLIVVDSHFDLRGKIDGKPTSGSSYGLAIDTLEDLSPRRVVELGIHGFLNSRTYFEKVRRLGITVVTAEQVKRKGPESTAIEALRIASNGADSIYLSVDLDAVDISYVSGVSAPSAGGLAAVDLFKLMYKFGKSRRIACADLVELAPSLDPTGKSERVAATALLYLIAGFVSRTKG